MDFSKYASELPYPDVEVEKNIAESKLLMPVYSGSSGELTAVMTYCFQMYVTPKYPDIHQALNGIAVTVIIMVVYTERERAIRLISARKATPQEGRMYYDYTQRN